MFKKITLATVIALSMVSTVAVAGDSLSDRQGGSECMRLVAPNICK